MKLVFVAAILTLTCTAACANKAQTASTTPQTAPPPAAAGAPAQTSGGGGSAGQRAAARLTPADLQARMQIIGPTSGSLRMKLMNNQLPDAAKDAQTLATAFADVERFWAQNNKQDAVMWAQQARMGAQNAAGAATAGDAMKATAAAGNMQAQCKQCHAVYREGDAQTGFRIKQGVLGS